MAAVPDCRWLQQSQDPLIDSLGYYNPQHPPALAVLGEALSAPPPEHNTAPQMRLILLAGHETAPPWHTGALARTPLPAHEAVYRLRRRYIELTAPRLTVHGVMLEVFGLGVLLSGEAGVGKSELALELLSRGHRLIADDAVELLRLPGALLQGRSIPLLRDFLEVRGLGILDVRGMFGAQAQRERMPLDLILHLQPLAAPPDYRQRLEGMRSERRVLDVAVPQITLPVTIGHNLATLVEAACRDQWLRRGGRRADVAFAERQQRAIFEPGAPPPDPELEF